MRFKDQDILTGLMFALIGAGSLFTIYYIDRLGMGTPQRPGTGVLPAILSWCLVGVGAVLVVKSFVNAGEQLRGWAWKPVLAVTAATVAFGMFVDDLGLIVTMIISLSICALGSMETRWPEYAVFLLIMIALGWSMFVWLLGMPIPTWPVRFPPELNFFSK